MSFFYLFSTCLGVLILLELFRNLYFKVRVPSADNLFLSIQFIWLFISIGVAIFVQLNIFGYVAIVSYGFINVLCLVYGLYKGIKLDEAGKDLDDLSNLVIADWFSYLTIAIYLAFTIASYLAYRNLNP